MSGGHFEYKQYDLAEIEEELLKQIKKNEFDKETLFYFLLAANLVHLTEIYINRIDWLLSGDDGEEEFKERLYEELQEGQQVVEKRLEEWKL